MTTRVGQGVVDAVTDAQRKARREGKRIDVCLTSGRTLSAMPTGDLMYSPALDEPWRAFRVGIAPLPLVGSYMIVEA